jgi:membrane protein
VIDFALRLAPIAFVAAALFAMYVILPNVRVRPLSALLGAGVAALLWHASLVVHVQLQMGVARYSALYSVLGAIPIFLVWTYVSWLVVLVGARIAAGHQDPADPRRRLKAPVADSALREEIAVALAAEVARDFVAGSPSASSDALARRLEIPQSVVEEVLDALVRAGVLARVISGRAAGFLPGRDVDAIRAEDVREALRRDPAAEPYRARVQRRLDPGLRRLLREEEERRRRSPENLTLRALAAIHGDGDEPAAGDGQPGGDAGEADDGQDRRPVVDEKQPDVPA